MSLILNYRSTQRIHDHINEKIITASDLQQIALMLAATCPYKKKECVPDENITLIPSENGTGWYFECSRCEAAKCTGFLRKD